MKLFHHYSSAILRRLCQVISTLDENQTDKAFVAKALNHAASRGLVEIFVGIAKQILRLYFALIPVEDMFSWWQFYVGNQKFIASYMGFPVNR